MPEENVSLEQVTSSKTYEYISFMKPFSLAKQDFVLVLSSDMLFCCDMCVVDMTFAWTSALTKCNVSQIVWTQPKPQSSDVACYGRMMCMHLRSQQADLAVLGRSAQAKSTMVKLGAPKAVGLPKPPQNLAKVRELVFVCLHCSSCPCLQE